MASLSHNPRPSDAGSALARRRDAVLRRWLGMEVERSSVGDLAERPLSARLRELEELFDAAVHELSSAGADGGGHLYDELADAAERHKGIGVPFTLALLAAPSGDSSGWLRALSEAAEEGTHVVDAGDGIAAAILPGVKASESGAAVDRLRALAWSATGCHGRLPRAGLASCPDDGCSPETLVGVAQERLGRLSGPERPHDPALSAPAPEPPPEPSPASVTPLYPEYS
jgi:hypothetical protein